MRNRPEDSVSSHDKHYDLRDSSAYNINFGKSTVVGSHQTFMHRTMGTHRSSLPPVVEHRTNSKRADIEELLHQLKTPTNPKVNVKFVKALTNMSMKSRSKDNSLSKETSHDHGFGEKFEEIFGLMAEQMP